MKINEFKVYGLDESILASGFPMQTTPSYDCTISDSDIKRAKHLGQALSGSGHDCYLKGITVQFNIKAPEYFYRQIDRYHFIDYISSQSKMHRILTMDIKAMCNEYVDDRAITILEEKIQRYNEFEIRQEECFKEYDTLYKKKLFQEVVSNCPMGIELTARMTTNYLQIKNIINQRQFHKLEEWHYFCNYMRTHLPMYNELIGI